MRRWGKKWILEDLYRWCHIVNRKQITPSLLKSLRSKGGVVATLFASSRYSLTYPNQLEPLGATSHCWKWQWGVDSVFGSLEATPCAKGGWYSCLYSYLVGMWEGHGWWNKASTDIQQDQITPPLATQQFFCCCEFFHGSMLVFSF